MKRACLALLLLAACTLALAAGPYTGPVFDAHLHYNDDAQAPYSVGSVFELFRKNGVRAILANSRPNDGTRALVEARQKAPSLGVQVVPFIRVYRNRDDYGTWFDNPDIFRMIVDEHKRGYYRGVGEFHVSGNDAAGPMVKSIVDCAVERDLYLHAHADDTAI